MRLIRMRAKKFSSFKETNWIAFSPLSHPLISWLNVSASKNYLAGRQDVGC
jgi:hypothetical protein